MIPKVGLLITALIGIFIFENACTSSDGSCESIDVSFMNNDVCLIIEYTDLNKELSASIVDRINDGLIAIDQLITLRDLDIRIVDNPNFVIPEIGMGGFNPNDNEVILAINENFSGLNQSINEELIPLLAHEIHHAYRRREVGYGSTLFQAIVSEGLADHFSIEVAGINPPIWSTALTGNELQDWINTASQSWDENTYNHQNWFVGTSSSIPRWTGYSIGFELVKDFLEENPTKSPSTLIDEPADSFKP